MSYDFSKFKTEIMTVEEWLVKEFLTIRTGMASPALLDGVKVDSYGTSVPINQVANVGVEDAKTLKINPFDVSQVKEIEKALTEANLGVAISADSNGVRVSFPDLTSERRDMLIKLAKEKLEKARVSLRTERDKVWDEIQKQQRDGEISEDEKFTSKDEMQKIVDGVNDKLNEMLSKKEKEISL